MLSFWFIDFLFILRQMDLVIFFWDGWKITKFVLSIFKDNLLAHSQVWTFFNSALTLSSSESNEVSVAKLQNVTTVKVQGPVSEQQAKVTWCVSDKDHMSAFFSGFICNCFSYYITTRITFTCKVEREVEPVHMRKSYQHWRPGCKLYGLFTACRRDLVPAPSVPTVEIQMTKTM